MIGVVNVYKMAAMSENQKNDGETEMTQMKKKANRGIAIILAVVMLLTLVTGAVPGLVGRV